MENRHQERKKASPFPESGGGRVESGGGGRIEFPREYPGGGAGVEADIRDDADDDEGGGGGGVEGHSGNWFEYILY
jgi:hypothetical protein